MRNKREFTIEETVVATAEAIKAGIILPAIKMALREHGFKNRQIEVMIRWAERKNLAA
jgi:hypothetical protein